MGPIHGRVDVGDPSQEDSGFPSVADVACEQVGPGKSGTRGAHLRPHAVVAVYADEFERLPGLIRPPRTIIHRECVKRIVRVRVVRVVEERAIRLRGVEQTIKLLSAFVESAVIIGGEPALAAGAGDLPWIRQHVNPEAPAKPVDAVSTLRAALGHTGVGASADCLFGHQSPQVFVGKPHPSLGPPDGLVPVGCCPGVALDVPAGIGNLLPRDEVTAGRVRHLALLFPVRASRTSKDLHAHLDHGGGFVISVSTAASVAEPRYYSAVRFPGALCAATAMMLGTRAMKAAAAQK